MTDKLDIGTIREREQKATAGAWERSYRELFAVRGDGGGSYAIGDTWYEEDADFIAHARTDIPTLLAEVERLRALNEHLRDDLRVRQMEILVEMTENARLRSLVGELVEACEMFASCLTHTKPRIWDTLKLSDALSKTHIVLKKAKEALGE